MSDSEDSFILISTNPNNNAGSVHSFDGWSEISIPSIRSNPIPTKNAKGAPATFSVFTGTYLQNSATLLPNFLNNKQDASSDKGYYLVSAPNPIQFSSNPSITHDSDSDNKACAGDNSNNITTNNPTVNANASIGSVGSRVPFSWAEIAKIQPQFHNQINGNKPKVFDNTPKIQTRYNAKNKPKDINNNSKDMKPIIYTDNDDMMPSIPESNVSVIANRSIRRRKGSKLRYSTGKRTKRWRKKTQKSK